MTLPHVEAMAPSELSVVVVNLCKGPIYRDTHERAWALLLTLRNQVADYVSVLGLQVIVDEAEGYAYLRSFPSDDAADDAEGVPKLIARRKLSFHVSLLLALLRKRLAEFDASSAETRLVLSRDQVVEMMRLYLPETTNDTQLVDTIGRHVNRVEELGFLRRLRGQDDLFEVRRIIKAYVDGQWLSDFEVRLDEYLADFRGRGGGEAS
jgi:hypothetical protein